MLYFVTGNNHKFQEVSSVLAGYGIELKQHPMNLLEPESGKPREVALHKAEQAFAKLRQPVIVEDTCIYFKAYKDFPGTLPKKMFLSLGYDGFFRLLKGKSRAAFCLCTICFKDNEDHYFFDGKLEGKITEKVVKPKANVMPYERIFVPKGSNKVVAELSRKEKNSISHRGIAARKLGEWLKEKTLHELIDSI